jgi:hypothetical protein
MHGIHAGVWVDYAVRVFAKYYSLGRAAASQRVCAGFLARAMPLTQTAIGNRAGIGCHPVNHIRLEMSVSSQRASYFGGRGWKGGRPTAPRPDYVWEVPYCWDPLMYS